MVATMNTSEFHHWSDFTKNNTEYYTEENTTRMNTSEVHQWSDFTSNTYTNENKTANIFIVDFRIYYRYGFEFILYGYFMPIWTLLNIGIYATMIYVFIQTGLTTKTHVCLIALAFSDSIAPVFPSLFWFYFFVVMKEYQYVPFNWCRAFHYLTELIPRIFTHMSYFFTIILAVQRYVVIAHPFKANRWCSRQLMYIMILVCFVCSVFVRLIHFFHYSYVKAYVRRSGNNNTASEVCAYGDPVWLNVKFSKYSTILQITHTIIVNIIPCIVLIVMECLMVKTLRSYSKSRQKLNLSSNVVSEMKRKGRRLTYTTVLVTAVLLIYKIPTIIIQVLDILNTMFSVKLFRSFYDLWTTNVVMNIFYWLCTPSNFIITCCLSHEFRNGFKNIFRKSRSVRDTVRVQNSGSSTMSSV